MNFLLYDPKEEEERGRQELDGDEAGADVGSGEASSEGDSDSDVNQEVEQADPDFALMHRCLSYPSPLLHYYHYYFYYFYYYIWYLMCRPRIWL